MGRERWGGKLFLAVVPGIEVSLKMDFNSWLLRYEYVLPVLRVGLVESTCVSRLHASPPPK